MGKPIICVDFDGVIHSYERGWQDGVIYGSATPGFFHWAAEAMKVFDLVVYSSRSKTPEGLTAMREAIGKWSVDAVHNDEVSGDFDWGGFFQHLTFSDVKPPAFLTIDDRAICFTGDWDGLAPQDLLEFKPWTMREPHGTTPDYVTMSPGEMLAAVGVDGMAWADAFMQIACMANPLGRELRAFPHGDRAPLHGSMLGWFCNAIEAGRSAGEQAMRRRLYPLFEQAVIHAPADGGHCLTIRYESPRDARLAHAALTDLAREVGIVGPSVASEDEAREAMPSLSNVEAPAFDGHGHVDSLALDDAFLRGAGANAAFMGGQVVAGDPAATRMPTDKQKRAVADIAAGVKLLHIARQFITDNKVGCAEDTVEDRVYENAPGLVEKLGEVVGFYQNPEEN